MIKEVLLIGSLIIISGCTYLEQHPEVVQEVEQEAEKVIAEVATVVIEAEIQKGEK